jgi:hypothetical protein
MPVRASSQQALLVSMLFLEEGTTSTQGNEGGKNCDHAHDGMEAARKSLDFLDLSEF